MRFKVGYGSKCAAPATAPAGLCPGAAAGAVRGASAGTEALRLEEKASPPRAASRNEENDHYNDDGTEPVNRCLDV